MVCYGAFFLFVLFGLEYCAGLGALGVYVLQRGGDCLFIFGFDFGLRFIVWLLCLLLVLYLF